MRVKAETMTQAKLNRSDRADVVRRQVRAFLSKSKSYKAMAPRRRRAVAQDMSDVVAYLAAPDGIPHEELPRTPQRSEALARMASEAISPRASGLAADILFRELDFPDFVAGLISGTFNAIVDATIEQMEAYGALLACVAKTADLFLARTATSDAHDYLICHFPDVFEPASGRRRSKKPCIKLRDGIDVDKALRRIKASLPIGGDPVRSLDERTLELRIVPAARSQLAKSRQQLLATMVLMGSNR